MKYGKVTLGQVEAAINKLGGQKVLEAWLRGEKIVTVTDAIKSLFDKHGRRIPEGLLANVCDADRNYRLDQPDMTSVDHYTSRIRRLHECLGVNTGITGEQLKTETERLLALIQEDQQIANIAHGIWLPVVLPQLKTDDFGTVLDQYLEGVGKSYVTCFGDRRFVNHHQGELAGQVQVVEGSRHDLLIRRMKQGSVMGIYFPNPLQGFSTNASREQMSSLSEVFILSGLDTALAMVMYPDILARGWNTTGLDLAALTWPSAALSFYFRSRDAELDFCYTYPVYTAVDGGSGGLLFLG